VVLRASSLVGGKQLFARAGDWGELSDGFTQNFVANLWTECAAHRSDALATNRKEPQNPNKLVVAATCEVAKT